MKIYVAHKSCYDFEYELYKPLRELSEFEFVFPHEGEIEDSKRKVTSADVVLAEVSYPSTGVGIELGWAEMSSKEIVCIYNKGSKSSSALQLVCSKIVEYESREDLKNKVRESLTRSKP